MNLIKKNHICFGQKTQFSEKFISRNGMFTKYFCKGKLIITSKIFRAFLFSNLFSVFIRQKVREKRIEEFITIRN